MTLDDILNIDDGQPPVMDFGALRKRLKMRAMVSKGRRSGGVPPTGTQFLYLTAPNGSQQRIRLTAPDNQNRRIALGV